MAIGLSPPIATDPTRTVRVELRFTFTSLLAPGLMTHSQIYQTERRRDGAELIDSPSHHPSVSQISPSRLFTSQPPSLPRQPWSAPRRRKTLPTLRIRRPPSSFWCGRRRVS